MGEGTPSHITSIVSSSGYSLSPRKALRPAIWQGVPVNTTFLPSESVCRTYPALVVLRFAEHIEVGEVGYIPMFSCQFFRLSGAEYGIGASRTPGFDESGECTAGRALFEYLSVVDVSAGNAFDFRVEQVFRHWTRSPAESAVNAFFAVDDRICETFGVVFHVHRAFSADLNTGGTAGAACFAAVIKVCIHQSSSAPFR